MSDEDRDVDIESDEEDDELGAEAGGSQPYSQVRNNENADKRAHHNALERKRRDHIKDSFHSLRDSVPDLQGEKVSRAQILKRAAEYIQSMREKNTTHQKDIESMKKANEQIESQIRMLEKYSATSKFSASTQSQFYANGQAVSESSEEEEANHARRKRLKTEDS
ncbi:protein max-like isoform X2 [Littorina saxatilis]|uniref:Protein max n=1 Tax=Littorina saxatilis TaxID=31220 RepID=A0AAN9BE12_9CAEN